jgi:hypothetical protein
MCRRGTKVGWTSTVRPRSRSHRKRRITESSLRWSQEKRGVGVQLVRDHTIRLLFDQPQRLRRISLVFEETETERTQEFVLRWSPDGGRSFREIVRQQWNFSPLSTIREVEEYPVELLGVTVLELVIVPDISRGVARASLKSLRVS